MSFSIACLDIGEDSQQGEVFIRNAIGIEIEENKVSSCNTTLDLYLKGDC
jgi:hypothetical protein